MFIGQPHHRKPRKAGGKVHFDFHKAPSRGAFRAPRDITLSEATRAVHVVINSVANKSMPRMASMPRREHV